VKVLMTKGDASGAFEDDVQQVGSDSEDGVSWDVQYLLTLQLFAKLMGII
jgi:hypothetical protein